MKIIENQKYLTIGEVAQLIRRNPQTIKNWYSWEESQGLNTLPPKFTNLDEKHTNYFREEDVKQLETFRDSIKYGQLAEWNKRNWGKRGKAIQARKGKKLTNS